MQDLKMDRFTETLEAINSWQRIIPLTKLNVSDQGAAPWYNLLLDAINMQVCMTLRWYLSLYNDGFKASMQAL